MMTNGIRFESDHLRIDDIRHESTQHYSNYNREDTDSIIESHYGSGMETPNRTMEEPHKPMEVIQFSVTSTEGYQLNFSARPQTNPDDLLLDFGNFMREEDLNLSLKSWGDLLRQVESRIGPAAVTEKQLMGYCPEHGLELVGQKDEDGFERIHTTFCPCCRSEVHP